ncbi:MAG: DUF302 domain-containing protein [Thiogranum sp.]|nr:DUF302 domain-containing protein [Thiogranum sp.]
MKRLAVLMIMLSLAATGLASPPALLSWDTGKDLETSYKVIYDTLEENRFFVVFEPDIQANLEGFAERWGDDYNRNRLEGIRAMVFCNGWYANAVSNADPDMMALCPLHITLIQQDGSTRILFVRPTAVARGSKAEAIAAELEQAVADALQQAVEALR